VGQSKKTVQELSDKYGGESTDNLQTLDSNTCMTDGDLNLCSRCRTRGTACDGKKGRACAPCKKSKLSCNLSSTRISAAKSKGAFVFAVSAVFSDAHRCPGYTDASKKSADTNSVAHAVMTRPRTSERSSTPTQRKLESWVESNSVPDAVLNGKPANLILSHVPHTLIPICKDQTARPSKPKSMSTPVICNGPTVQEGSSRTLKRKRSSDSLDTQRPLLWIESNHSTSKVILPLVYTVLDR
jgi:hypothetical protein